MSFSIIAALTNNRVIGKSNTIPWFFSRDMMWFKYHTLNKVVVMGHKTFKSINNRPLLNRLNIVLSRKNIMESRNISNLIFVTTFGEVLWHLRKICRMDSEIMIIGGGEIYNLFFPRVNRLYLTCINMDILGDVYFPHYEKDEWKVIFNENNHCDRINCAYSLKIFKRSC